MYHRRKIWFLIFILCYRNYVLGKKKKEIRKLPMGALFDWDDEPAKSGFLFAIANFNSKKDEFILDAAADSLDIRDSYNLAQAICSHMSNGVFMLFGARRFESRNIVQAYTETFHIPYVSPSYADNEPRNLNTYQLHMKPSHTRALVHLIRHYQWKSFHYVYDSEEGLFSLQNILSVFEKEKYYVQVRMRRLQDVDNAHEDLRALDKQCDADNESLRYIVLDLSTELAYYKIMKQIREVGMNKQGYNYILGTLDFSNLEMERYQHGGVNITGFQLVNYNSTFNMAFLELWSALDPDMYEGSGNKTIHIDAAIAVDSLTVIQKTLSKLMANSSNIFKHTFRRGMVYNYNKTKGVPCSADPPTPWMHGESLMKGMKSLVFEGVTGHIEFDEAGFRTNYSLDIYNVGLNKKYKIGTWSPSGGFYTDTNENYNRTTKNDNVKIWRVTTILAEPFMMEKKKKTDKKGRPFVGNEIYEGYCADLAKKIALTVGFEYEITLVGDANYGANVTEGNVTRWNGMIGELIDDVADIAVAGLSITSDRERVVRFSKPFMDVGISIMIKKPEKKKPGVFSFMQPFTIDLWVCIVLGYFSVGVGIFIVSRFSSAEWRRSRTNHNLKYNKFTIANSMWFAMGSLMLQGSDETCPRSSSGRIIGGAWWFAVLITISSYTANLAAFLTIERLMTPIESADDLVKQTEISYGTLESGSTQDFFKTSKIPTYQSMWAYMDNANPSVFVNDIKDGVDRVRNSKGKYAFLCESVHNEFYSNRKPCNTMKVGHNINLNHYGIATQKESPLRDDITLAVLRLKEDGTLEKMKKEWWIDKGECGFNTGRRESKKKSLSLSNVAGIYYILIAGLVLAIIVGVCEFIYIKSKPDTRMSVGVVYMMPAPDTADNINEGGTPLENLSLNNHKTENGPNSNTAPMNGNAHSNNHHNDNIEKHLLENASNYNAPNYNAANYNAPNYTAPNYTAPNYNAPNYNASNYNAFNYNVPKISFDVDPHTSV